MENMNSKSEQPLFSTLDIPEYNPYDNDMVHNPSPSIQCNQEDIISIIERYNLSYRLGKVVEVILSGPNVLGYTGKLDEAIVQLIKHRACLK